MAIDGGMRDRLEAGTKLVARYKGEQHEAEVVAGEDGKTRYRLADGREFKSPSAAASAVMGGQAANGWRFWSIAGAEGGETAASTPDPQTVDAAAKPRPQCPRCGKSFVGAAQLAHHDANANRLCVAA